MRVEPQAGEDARIGDDEQKARVDLRHQPSHHREDEELDPAAHQEYAPDVERAVMQDRAAIEREENRAGEDGGADEKVESGGRRIGAIAEDAQIRHGMLVLELVRDESDQRDGGNDGQDGDGPVLEPVVAVSFLENVLQGDHADGQERDAESVDRGAVGDEGRLLDLRPRDPGGDEAQGKVDEENPMPTGPLHQVSADGGAEQRSGDRSDGEESAGHSVLLFRIAREEHALRSRDDRPATQTLEDAEA